MAEHTTLPSGSSGESKFLVLDELGTVLQQALSLAVLISVDSDAQPRHVDAAQIAAGLLIRARGFVEQLLADDKRGRNEAVEPERTPPDQCDKVRDALVVVGNEITEHADQMMAICRAAQTHAKATTQFAAEDASTMFAMLGGLAMRLRDDVDCMLADTGLDHDGERYV